MDTTIGVSIGTRNFLEQVKEEYHLSSLDHAAGFVNSIYLQVKEKNMLRVTGNNPIVVSAPMGPQVVYDPIGVKN